MEDVTWEYFKTWLWLKWLQPERDTPHAVLTLRRIAEFEQYAEDDVAELREFKDFLGTRTDRQARATLRWIVRLEETEEPWEMLAHFKRWLQQRGIADANAHLTAWWISQFESLEATLYEHLPSPTVH
jgi:hypothetical protein